MFAELEACSEQPPCDVLIVGAGPVGLATALACEDAGLRVLVIESGQVNPSKDSQSLSDGHKYNPERHVDPSVAICRALGGTSHWWGGRCVPFDDVDFIPRASLAAGVWPVSHEEIRQYYSRASEFFGVESARFERRPEMTPDLGSVMFDKLERWAPNINMGRRHLRRLQNSLAILVVLGTTVVDIDLIGQNDAVSGVTVVVRNRGHYIKATKVILASGGLEATRLMLSVQRFHPEAFGGKNGPLGRYYMGHISGRIADLVLSNPKSISDHEFFLDRNVFVRRRLQLTAEAQLREGLQNAAFWIDNPPFYAAEHGSGVLSAVWIALAFPLLGKLIVPEGVRRVHVGARRHTWGRHVANLVRSPMSTVGGTLDVLADRYLRRPRRPSSLIRNRSGRYSLHYHAEHGPCRESRVDLSDRKDRFGLPFLEIDLRFAERDAVSVIRSHEILDAALQRSGVGRLDFYESDRRQRIDAVLAQATDGFHQIGTVKMSHEPKDGVVDANCRVHGVENLWVVGSAVLPTSGQANPTFVAVAIGIRLAEHLREAGG